MHDYPRHQVIIVLGHWEELLSIRERATKGISLDSGYTEVDNSYWEQEGNTFQKRGPRGTRIPKNSNARIEALTVIMADIQNAIKVTCDYEEAYSLVEYCKSWTEDEDGNLSQIVRDLAEQALEKVVSRLNCTAL